MAAELTAKQFLEWLKAHPRYLIHEFDRDEMNMADMEEVWSAFEESPEVNKDAPFFLFWCSGQRDMAWFAVARHELEALQTFDETTPLIHGAERLMEIPKGTAVTPDDFPYPSDDLIEACGGKFLEDSTFGRVVRIGDTIYEEGKGVVDLMKLYEAREK
jgi:hypothetical protein